MYAYLKILKTDKLNNVACTFNSIAYVRAYIVLIYLYNFK